MKPASILLLTLALPALLAGPDALAGVDKELTPEELLKMRDPFKRVLQPRKVEGPKSELEEHPVDQFKLMGVIKGMDRPRAMIAGPTGKTYFVSDGARIGTRRGVIRKITADTVVVREKFVNLLGKEENIETELKLSSSDKPAAKLGLGW